MIEFAVAWAYVMVGVGVAAQTAQRGSKPGESVINGILWPVLVGSIIGGCATVPHLLGAADDGQGPESASGASA